MSRKFFKTRFSPIRPDVGFYETFKLLSSASAELLWWLGAPGKWAANFGFLLLFVIVMLPALLPAFIRYLWSAGVRKNLMYGSSIRHQLDVYLPSDHKRDPSRRRPVVIFISGGAWIIGYKTWAFLMGLVFQDNGVVFVAPDYRNFPQGRIPDMVKDVSEAIRWTFENLEELGGDANNVTLMGQSAGAHLAALCVIDAAEKEAALEKLCASHGLPELVGKEQLQAGWWRMMEQVQRNEAGAHSSMEGMAFSCRQLSRFVGISGPYNILKLIPFMQARGLPKNVLNALVAGDPLKQSPACRVLDLSPHAVSFLPKVSLFHGTADATVPHAQTVEFAMALERAGGRVETVKLYEGKSHTDPILEDPCKGSDPLMLDLLNLITAKDSSTSSLSSSPSSSSLSSSSSSSLSPIIQHRRLHPRVIAVARWLNPF
uniref:BD-FAE-like domain-containing protein n=2 Tax=Guillardia theta TaxID=55529 RepID=A0A7S4H9D5_GUITH|mmetsp:Transcript_11040/g.37516  ORF Transcript_11040/g.37516 Transcript_11040/m.37516 type:complete len:429 (+) Transcript_11040:448-1734(+)